MLDRDNFNPSDPLGTADTDKRFTFALNLPARDVPFEIPPVEGLDPLDEQAVSPIIGHSPTYHDTQLSSPAMIGTYDSWVGEVTKVYDADADAEWGQKGVVEIRRASPYWAGGAFGLDEIPSVDSQPQRSVEHAFPFPAVDQEAYRVAVDDPVVVITGRDGKCYYLPDDRPFIGKVAQNPDDESVKETNFGGAGNTTIKVTRQLLDGDPTKGEHDLTTGTTITYDYVYPLTAEGQHHGHRVGDTVLCFRRGEYVFCLPARGVYHGKIIATPDGEDALTDDRYWVSLVAGNVTYTGDVNVWTWGTDTALFTVVASNLPERGEETHDLDDGTEVVVTLFADATSTDKSAYWGFAINPSSEPAAWFKAYEEWTYSTDANGCYIMCHPCDDQDGASEDTDTDVKVWLPRNGDADDAADPNIPDNAVLAATLDANGEYVGLDSRLDGTPFRSIRMWHGGGNDLPTGWALLDGSEITTAPAVEGWAAYLPDLRGRFIVDLFSGINDGHTGHGDETDVLGGASDYAGLAEKGGTSWHGQGEYTWDSETGNGTTANNHPDHDVRHHHTVTTADHHHSIGHNSANGLIASGAVEYVTGVNSATGDAGAMDAVQSSAAIPTAGGITEAGALEHGGINVYEDTDNRPAFYTLAFIMRIDNSEDGGIVPPAELWRADA